ncbi:hypothetical protein [Microbacterium sp. zg.Y1084]|uniref:DUF6414 family protein n=1 Tax=Microbacterium sp. zg.Y1084 TaxID=2969667 RepID=UPI00214CBC09|nr:hypothetical protein [Microbacterium sp. zg.Y1084]MCR2812581.1 hypothetical protein [Microbacterium sp. zg.Y1084]
MGGYKAPKKRLHREFMYLNYDTIINSLSAFEAGKVDEILQKVSEASDGGLSGSLGANVGPANAKVSAGKKKSASMEEELTRSRTHFSAFDSWIKHLDAEDGVGELTAWDVETRDEIEVGDTVRFEARVTLSKVQQVFFVFLEYVAQAGDPNSVFKQPTAKVAELKKQARPIENMIRGAGNGRNIQVLAAPFGVDSPRVVARLDEQYLVGGAQMVEGDFTVIAQVSNLVDRGEVVPALRILRDTPPTPVEVTMMTNVLDGFRDAAGGLGVTIDDSDTSYEYPAVIVHPIAIYR